MKKFVIEEPIFEIFPQIQAGILVCRGIDNHIKDESRYEDYLREAEKAAAQYVTAPEFTDNPVIRTWRDAFYKFKTEERCPLLHRSPAQTGFQGRAYRDNKSSGRYL